MPTPSDILTNRRELFTRLDKEREEKRRAQEQFDVARDSAATALVNNAEQVSAVSLESASAELNLIEDIKAADARINDLNAMNPFQRMASEFVGTFTGDKTKTLEGNAETIQSKSRTLAIQQKDTETIKRQLLANEQVTRAKLQKSAGKLESETQDVQELRQQIADETTAFQQEQNLIQQQIESTNEKGFEKLLSSGQATAQQIKEERQRRRSKDLSIQMQELALQTNSVAAQTSSKNLRLESFTVGELNQLILSARKSGVAEDDVTQNKFDIKQLTDRRNELVSAASSETALRAETSVIQQQFDATSIQLERLNGLNSSLAATSEATLETLIQSPDTPDDIRQGLINAKGLMDAANNDSNSTQERLQLSKAALTTANKVIEIQKQKELSIMPKEQQPAADQFLTTGKMQNIKSSAAIFADSLLLAGTETSGSVIYDAGIDVFLNDETGLLNEKTRDLITAGATDFTTEVLKGLQSPELKNQSTSAIMNQGRFELYKELASALGDDEMLTEISLSNGRIALNGAFQEQVMFSFIAQRNPDGSQGPTVQDYQRAVNEGLTSFTQRNFESDGQQKFLKATVNRLLFGNQIQSTFIQSTRRTVANGFANAEQEIETRQVQQERIPSSVVRGQ